jgi:glycosyltransferase involved in cell wall biosynthesis
MHAHSPSDLHVGIDARAASHPQTGGFKTHVLGLVGGLAQADPTGRYTLYLDRPASELHRLAGGRATRVVVGQPVPVIGAAIREQLLLPRRMSRDGLDVLHSPAGTMPLLSPVPVVVTIHDAIEHMPAFMTGTVIPRRDPRRQLMSAYSRMCQGLAARRARLIVTVSERSAADLERYLGVGRSLLRVVSQAPAPTFRPLDVPRRLPGRDTAFILAIGSADPRKDVETLLRAYARLPTSLRRRYQLGLVWTHAAQRQRLLRFASRLSIIDDVVSLSAPRDEDLCELYNRASVFVFPSRYEGFGLPPLEAMACGTPVIASAGGALPEVLGDAALYFSPRSDQALADRLITLLEAPTLWLELAARGSRHASSFSWAREAARLRDVYREASTNP